MKKGILILCAVALLVSFATAAMASDDYWVVKFKAGWLTTTTSNNDTLVIGASAATAGGSDTFNSSYANIVSVVGTAPSATYIGTHRVAPAAGSTYTFNMLVAPGTAFPTGTGANAGQVYISVWTPETYTGTAGRALPSNYTVSVVGNGIDRTWTYDQLHVASDPSTTGIGPVGFWYNYGEKSASYTDANANDFFTVTVAPVPEPGSLMALGSGLVGLAGFAIRRRRA